MSTNNAVSNKPEVRPHNECGPHRQHSITGLSAKEVEAIIGFPQNAEDDPNKVAYSWGFTVNGEFCAVWDYKGSHEVGSWSAYGPKDLLWLLFGSHLRGE